MEPIKFLRGDSRPLHEYLVNKGKTSFAVQTIRSVAEAIQDVLLFVIAVGMDDGRPLDRSTVLLGLGRCFPFHGILNDFELCGKADY